MNERTVEEVEDEKKEFNYYSSPINIFIIGQVVVPLLTASILGNDALTFTVNNSLGYIITNPYESPDLWNYSPIKLPHILRNRQTNEIIAYLNWYTFRIDFF